MMLHESLILFSLTVFSRGSSPVSLVHAVRPRGGLVP